MSRFASGVTVVSTRDAAGKLHGLTVTAFCSVSLDPPMVLVCVEKIAASHTAIEESGVFVVNILNGSQSAASEKFADPFIEKFGDGDFEPGIHGLPVINDAIASLECSLTFAYHGGDHSIFVGQVENVAVANGAPLIYFRGQYGTVPDME